MNQLWNHILPLAVLFGISSASSSSFAQTAAQTSAPAPAKAGAKQAGGEKKKSLSFEDELVQGATAKPELEYILTKKNFNFKRLIKLRENFQPEMRRTSEDVGRGRGSN